MRDQSRQWGETVSEIKTDHVKRYELAAKYANGRVLDAACGCGYGSSILYAMGAEVVAVDASADAIGWAEKCFPGPRYVRGRIEEAPWEGSFETVVSLETIEHVPNPEAALKAFRRACTGKLIASVPNEEFYPFIPATFARDESPHYRHYTPDQFQALLEENGFTVLERFCQKSKQQPEIVPGTDGRYMIYVCS